MKAQAVAFIALLCLAQPGAVFAADEIESSKGDPGSGSSPAPVTQPATESATMTTGATPANSSADQSNKSSTDQNRQGKGLSGDTSVAPVLRPVLKGQAEAASLPITVNAISGCPVMHYRGKKLTCYAVHFKNLTDQVVIIDGDNSKADAGKEISTATSAGALLRASSSNLSTKGKILCALVTVGTIGLGGIIFGEMITPDQHKRRDLENSIGIDGVRHDIERARFGRRLVMPGDETQGWMGFECADAAAIRAVKVPIWFSPMRSPATYLDVPVRQPTSL
jgi:hypothetical protein